jgi:hypothetical protein
MLHPHLRGAKVLARFLAIINNTTWNHSEPQEPHYGEEAVTCTMPKK